MVNQAKSGATFVCVYCARRAQEIERLKNTRRNDLHRIDKLRTHIRLLLGILDTCDMLHNVLSDQTQQIVDAAIRAAGGKHE
jgi:hypothetical protein